MNINYAVINGRRIRREFVEEEAALFADEYVGSKPDDLSEVDPKLLAALDDTPERKKTATNASRRTRM